MNTLNKLSFYLWISSKTRSTDHQLAGKAPSTEAPTSSHVPQSTDAQATKPLGKL